MIENARQRLNMLKTTKGSMTSGARDGFNILLDEHEKNAERMTIQETKLDDLSKRLNVVEITTSENSKTSTEILKMVNEINKKISDGGMEDKAAQMDFLQRIVGSKFGKAVIIFFTITVIASGVALVYFINNYKQVTEIVDSIKK